MTVKLLSTYPQAPRGYGPKFAKAIEASLVEAYVADVADASMTGSPVLASLTDRIGLGVLTRLLPRELVEEVVISVGRKEQRNNKLPARVVVYFVLAMTLFHGESYEEVMRKLVDGLRYMGTWHRDWSMPTSAALCQARQRLGAEVIRELYERVAVPCAMRSTKGAWAGGRRLMALDGFGMEAPDTPDNAAYFGYKKKSEKCAFPHVNIVGLAECGTHAVVAAEIGRDGEGERTLADRVLASGAVEPDMLITADAGLYSYDRLQLILDAGADALFRVGASLDLPVLEWLPDGSYLSYIADPAKKRRATAKLRNGELKITDLPGVHVRVVDYQVPDRNDGGELITLVTNVLDSVRLTAVDLAMAYHERWEIETLIDEIKTHQRGPATILRSRKPEMVEQEIWGLLLTHYGIRHLMCEAADQAELDPDRLSFIRSLRVVRRQVSNQAAFSPSTPQGKNPRDAGRNQRSTKS